MGSQSCRAAAFVAAALAVVGVRVCARPAENPYLGLPPVETRGRNNLLQARVALGKRLFFDPRLSNDGTISCATCHIPARAFTDGRAVARGISGRLGTRNTPSIWNALFLNSEFWDGRRLTLESQAIDPLLDSREQGFGNQTAILYAIHRDARYASLFAHAFGPISGGITVREVAIAIATFERTLIAGDSPFDRYYYGHQPTALSPAAIRGLAIFQGRAQCSTCHVIGKHYALFTDNRFHSLGVGLRELEPRMAAAATLVAHASPTALDNLIIDNADVAALGRFVVTKDPRDIGKFRTPSLRNVALTAPYMHNGSARTLADAVNREIYYRGLRTNVPLILTPHEKKDLLAFLDSLTSPNARNDQ